jgi:hypothetical protein
MFRENRRQRGKPGCKGSFTLILFRLDSRNLNCLLSIANAPPRRNIECVPFFLILL